jgi:chromosomal replication initiator protein
MQHVESVATPFPTTVSRSPQRVWEDCLRKIQENVSSLSFKTWFQPIVPLKLEKEELTVEVPSQFFYDWVEEHYNDLIRRTITSVLGSEARLFYSIASDDTSAQPDHVDLSSSLPGSSVSLGVQGVQNGALPFSPHVFVRAAELPPNVQSNLNPRYTFENFIKGDSNQLARAAALAVANNPGGTSFNPLVMYGGTGLGKTHLMHALGNNAIELGKAKRVVYVSSEKFTVEFVEAIQADRINEFSHFYRSVDLLIVDDIQFFSGKEKTQDNFFHTFNTLYQLGKQIVLSSDVPPKELKGLDERLISRFQSGLTADIQPPDLETRIAILQKKSQENGLEMPQGVIEFIATNVTNNIRELEGCLISLLARASLENREINVELARDVLRVVANDIKAPISIEQIQKTVCAYFDLPEDLLRAKTRKQEIVTARQVAMFLAKQLTNASLKTIGLHFGGRDHSTVIHAYQSTEDRMKTDSIRSIRKRLMHSEICL